jgi:hypothetical protein
MQNDISKRSGISDIYMESVSYCFKRPIYVELKTYVYLEHENTVNSDYFFNKFVYFIFLNIYSAEGLRTSRSSSFSEINNESVDRCGSNM